MNRLHITSLLLSLCCLTALAGEADARYIFYFIGDGMGTGHASATALYRRTADAEKPLLMTTLPVQGLASTHSASSPVTDSAAAGTALATGSKTKNGMVGMTPDSVAVTSIAKKLQADGFGIGIVTNVSPDDATPAAFYANVPNRRTYADIDRQAPMSGFNFIGGSNWRSLPADSTAIFEQAGYVTLRGPEGFSEVTSDKVVMLSQDPARISDLGYAIDSLGLVTLPELTACAIRQLERVSPDRFFLMVEGGNIDWAGHANDGAAIIRETIRFNEALDEAWKFYEEHPEETLIVVTADHETGGMSVGNTFHYYNAFPMLTDTQRISKDRFNEMVEAMVKSRRLYRWDDMREILAENTGLWSAIKLSDEEEKELEEAFDLTFNNPGADRTATYYRDYSPLVMKVFRILNDHYGFGFTTYNHSGNMVPVYAVGAGADLFNGVYDNTDIPRKIMQAATSGR